MKRINVLIFTYKQQDLIIRAVESILCQKEYGLNHIVVSDDCSPDNTWRVLENYKKQYPDIMRIYQNTHNLGIYGNWNQMLSHKGEADMFYVMAGDDALCEGVFEKVQNVIQKESIDCSQSLALYFDWKRVLPSGKEYIIKNAPVLKYRDTFGIKLRNRISCNGCFVSSGLMKDYPSIDLSYGVSLAETLADLQYSLLAKRNYYESYTGAVYYAGIGVSTSLFTKDYCEEAISSNLRIQELFNLKGSDRKWIQYRIQNFRYRLSPSFLNLVKTVLYYFRGVKYGPIQNVKQDLVGILMIYKNACKKTR